RRTPRAAAHELRRRATHPVARSRSTPARPTRSCAGATQILVTLGAVPSLPPSTFTKRCEIRWRDMDAFRHVNNSVYLTYLEETRDEWFLEVLGNGLQLTDFVLARCAIDFRSPLTQDDGDVDVEVRC